MSLPSPDVRITAAEAADPARLAERLGRVQRNFDALGALVTDWTDLPFSGAWRHYQAGSTAWGEAQYRRLGREVQLRGLADKNGGAWVGGEQVALLPEGFRPPQNLLWGVQAQSTTPAAGLVRLDVYTDGRILVAGLGGLGGNVEYLSLNPVRFDALT